MKTLSFINPRNVVTVVTLVFGAWWWYAVQIENIQLLVQQKQYEQDIENEFNPIDEITRSMFNRISDQEIRTEENIDKKGKNDYLQFKYSYIEADTNERRISLTNEYSIVIRKQLSDWEREDLSCDFHVCKQYAQYVNELSPAVESYRASKKQLESKLPSLILKKLHSEAYNL